MDFHGFHRFSWVFVDLVSWMLGGDKAQPAAPIETFARFQAFHGFHRFSWILMVFRWSGGREFAGLKIQPAALIETFARFQLPAIIDSLMLAAGWLVGWLAGDDWLLLGGMEDWNNGARTRSTLRRGRRNGRRPSLFLLSTLRQLFPDFPRLLSEVIILKIIPMYQLTNLNPNNAGKCRCIS